MDTGTLTIIGLFINFAAILFNIFKTHITLERRITRLETMITMILRAHNIHIRKSDTEEYTLNHDH